MKTVVGPREEVLEIVQKYIDSYPDGATVAIAYNEDISELNFTGKKTLQVMDCGNLISSQFNFDIPIDKYEGQNIDLAVLGLGFKAQIGFNEIATPYNSTKHIQKLTDSTKEEFSIYGNVPEEGVTLGIKDIIDAKNIIVLALGKKRAEAVFNMLYGRDDSTVPAAFLQIPPNVEVYVDEEAGSKL